MTVQMENIRPRQVNPLGGVICRGQERAREIVQKASMVGKYMVEHRKEIAKATGERLKENAPAMAAGAATRIAVKSGMKLAGAATLPAAAVAVSVGSGVSKAGRATREWRRIGTKKFYEKHAGRHVRAEQEREEAKGVLGKVGRGLKLVGDQIAHGIEERAVNSAFKVGKRRERVIDLSVQLEHSSEAMVESYVERARRELGDCYEQDVKRRAAILMQRDMTDSAMAHLTATDEQVDVDSRAVFNSLSSAAKLLGEELNESCRPSVLKAVRQARKEAAGSAIAGLAAAQMVKGPARFFIGAAVVKGVMNGTGRALAWAKETVSDAFKTPTAEAASEMVVERVAQKAVGVSKQTLANSLTSEESLRATVRGVPLARVSQPATSPSVSWAKLKGDVTDQVESIKEARRLASLARTAKETIELKVDSGSTVYQEIVEKGIFSPDEFKDPGSGRKYVGALLDGFVKSGKVPAEHADELKKAVAENPNISLGQLWSEQRQAFSEMDQVVPGEKFTAVVSSPAETVKTVSELTSQVNTSHEKAVLEAVRRGGRVVGRARTLLDPVNDPPAPSSSAGHYEKVKEGGRWVIKWVSDVPDSASASPDVGGMEGGEVPPVSQPETASDLASVGTGTTGHYEKVREGGKWVIKWVGDGSAPIDPAAAPPPVSSVSPGEVSVEAPAVVVGMGSGVPAEASDQIVPSEASSARISSVDFFSSPENPVYISTDHQEIFDFQEGMVKALRLDVPGDGMIDTPAPSEVTYFIDPEDGGIVASAHSGWFQEEGKQLMEGARQFIEGGPLEQPRFGQTQVASHLVELEQMRPTISVTQAGQSLNLELYDAQLVSRDEVLTNMPLGRPAQFLGDGEGTLSFLFCGRSHVDALKIFDELSASLPDNLKKDLATLNYPNASAEELKKAIERLVEWLKIHDYAKYEEFRWKYDGFGKSADEIRKQVPDFYSWTRYVLRFRVVEK